MITFLSRLTVLTKGSCWSTIFPLTHTMACEERKRQILCVQDKLKILIAWTEVKNWLLYQEPGILKDTLSACLAKAGGSALSLGAQDWASFLRSLCFPLAPERMGNGSTLQVPCYQDKHWRAAESGLQRHSRPLETPDLPDLGTIMLTKQPQSHGHGKPGQVWDKNHRSHQVCQKGMDLPETLPFLLNQHFLVQFLTSSHLRLR